MKKPWLLRAHGGLYYQVKLRIIINHDITILFKELGK